MTLCLTPEEIEDLTQKKRYSAQIRVLTALGIELKRRPDGSVLVDRAHYEEWARGSSGRRARQSAESERKTYPIWNS
jgi:hypothetical protein